MTDYPMKFRFKIYPELNSIGTNRIQTDKDIPGKCLTVAIIKGNHIGIIVMVQILAIDVQNIIVITKNKRQSSYSSGIMKSDYVQPVLNQFSGKKCRKFYTFFIEQDFLHKTRSEIENQSHFGSVIFKQ